MRSVLACALAIMTLTASGCGLIAGDNAAQSSATASQAAAKPKPKPKPLNAGQILAALKKAGVPIKTIIVFNAKTDPNEKLGRPGQYISKAACVDSRIPKAKLVKRGSIENGCGVEVFKTAMQAKVRATYLKTVMEALGSLAPSEYRVVRGNIVLRVSGTLTPKEAKAYKAPFLKLPI